MSTVHVSGKGFFDLFDEVFWMLPFNSERQAKRVRQDNIVLDKAWDARRKIISSEHRLPHESTELMKLWKEISLYNTSNGEGEPTAVEDVEDDKLPVESDP
jgi:hypothetical protein